MFNWDNKKLSKAILFISIFATPQIVWSQDAGYYGLGEPATKSEIAGWDIDVRPDGQGLPEGSGSVSHGEELYDAKCASCHGAFGEGEGRWPKLAGGMGTLNKAKPDKTVGSYWPYASTLWDYIHRAMPFTAPQSLTADETYSLTAYVLYLNGIVEEDFELTHDNFTQIEMPNKDGFYVDDRPDVKNPACMENCKDPKTIKITSAIKGITPLDHVNKKQKSNEKNSSEHDAQNSNKQEELSKESSINIGRDIYGNSCAICHGQGVAGAPKFGEKLAWESRITKGLEILKQHALEGYTGESGVMPAKGGNPSLTEQEINAAVSYMIESIH